MPIARRASRSSERDRPTHQRKRGSGGRRGRPRTRCCRACPGGGAAEGIGSDAGEALQSSQEYT
eukprot:10023565-Alexandrium_andersonii.AAC.1